MTDLYRCTPRQVRKFAKECLYAGLVPYIQSSPGMGKSAIVHSIAHEESLSLIDHRLSTSPPEDMSGLPEFYDTPNGRRARFVPFGDLFPVRGDSIPDGNQGWMLFLDEFNSASKQTQAAAYKLILDRMTGQHHLHDNVVICAAGNLATDRAIVNPLSTAMQSRVVHLEMQVNFDEWLYDVALKENYDSRIIAYLSQYPSKLMDFRPDHNDKTFCCPRTWEFMNRLVQGKTITDESASLLAGTITSGTAAEFVQFTKVYSRMISINDILADPTGMRIPDETDMKWAVISHMMEKTTYDNFGDLSLYADRFTVDFRILFYRSVLVRQPKLHGHPAFCRAMSTLSKWLHG